MIRIQQLKLEINHTQAALEKKLRRYLRLKPKDKLSYEIIKRSIDARHKPDIFYQYVIDCTVENEEKQIKGLDGKKAQLVTRKEYQFPATGHIPLEYRPVIIGTGPAGLYCGYFLAKYGYRPILLERGADVDTRQKDVERFWNGGTLKENSNVQFGEGGAGTFSDGKLNTLVKDVLGRNREALRIFVEAGADASILYEQKPHLGTDKLIQIVKRIRTQIEQYGGTVRFNAEVTDFKVENGLLTGLVINGDEFLPCKQAVCAIGHSARNTFETLYQTGISMQAKEFAMGFRVEHSQAMINMSQYGKADCTPLQAADYKLTAKTKSGRGVYSFCMCPGGYVVNASSEPKRLAINGMSYSGRDGENANSAIIISVKTEDFETEHPLAGIAFQRKMEEAAFRTGEGKIPVQRFGDLKRAFYKSDVEMADSALETDALPRPNMKGSHCFTDISKLLPEEMMKAFFEGMEHFGKIIEGFDREDTLISAIESRTSSPVRIMRDEAFQSNIKGIYPCGEGAGYAGGIMSAAMDGMKVAEAIASYYQPFEENMRNE